MTRYRFPGYITFLENAAREIGHPEAVAPARRITTLAALANLCTQASDADPLHVPAILAKAAEFRDQLNAAHRAAELMIEDANRAFGSHNESEQVKHQRRTQQPQESGRKKPCQDSNSTSPGASAVRAVTCEDTEV